MVIAIDVEGGPDGFIRRDDFVMGEMEITTSRTTDGIHNHLVRRFSFYKVPICPH
jgi:hypothetical protein